MFDWGVDGLRCCWLSIVCGLFLHEEKIVERLHNRVPAKLFDLDNIA